VPAGYDVSRRGYCWRLRLSRDRECLVCAVVIRRVCELVRLLQLLVVTSNRCQIHPISNSHPVSNNT
jgi:hypothetical protein